MTKVYRLTTSQVDGVDANNNDTGRVPLRGEIGLYSDNNKLVLVIGDGVKTHQESKVLSPGVLYGSNADSGDGAGLDTIKLIPDATISSDQYLIVDPTFPNHIHLRAGGTIDNSTAELFVGGEKNFVKVSDSSDSVEISTDNGIGTNTWTFGTYGDLTVPNNIILNTSILSPSHGEDDSTVLRGNLDKNIYIETFTQNGFSTWKFDSLGNLTLPGGMKINSGDYGGADRLIIDATTGGDGYLQLDASSAVLVGYNSVCNVTIGNNGLSAANTMTELISPRVKFLDQNVPASSVGSLGDQPGLVAFDANYIYYCTGTFSGTTYNVLHSIAEGTSANGFDQGYLVASTYQLPQVGWNVYYNGETRTIDQVNDTGVPGFYVIFVDSSLVIPGQASFAWGPTSSTDIWKRVAWSVDTW